MDWYKINNIEKVDSPSLIVYPTRVKENIDRLIRMEGSADLLRPHVKTNKIAEVYRESRINQWRDMSSRGLDALEIVGMARIGRIHQHSHTR